MQPWPQTDRRLFCLFKNNRLTHLLFNYGLMLCGLSLFPLLSQGGHLLKFSVSFPLDNYYYNRFFRKVNTFFKNFLKRFFRRISSNYFLEKKDSRFLYCLSFLLLQEIEWVGNVQKSHNKIYYRNKRPCNQGKITRGFRAFSCIILQTFINIVPVSLCDMDEIEDTKPIDNDSDNVKNNKNFHF